MSPGAFGQPAGTADRFGDTGTGRPVTALWAWIKRYPGTGPAGPDEALAVIDYRGQALPLVSTDRQTLQVATVLVQQAADATGCVHELRRYGTPRGDTSADVVTVVTPREPA